MASNYYTVDEAYKQNKDLNREDVLTLEEWVNKQEHLPKISEIKLILFLHACCYRIEATKTCIDNYFTIKAHWPEFSLQRNVFSDEMRQIFQVILASVMPLRTKQGYVIMYGRLFNSNPEYFHHINFIKAMDMITSVWLKIFGPTEGIAVIMDTEGTSFGHLIKINLIGVRNYLYYIQEALPVRLKAIHIINISPMFYKLFSMSKPFIKKELMDIIHMHTEMNSLYDDIPKASLPFEYGGEAGNFEEIHQKQMKLLEENAEYLIGEEKEIADESKRIGKSKNLDYIFGTEGTFRKLEID